MPELIDISEKFRVAATDVLFGDEEAMDRTVNANPDHEELVVESFELADRIQRSHVIRSLDRYAAHFGGKPPQAPDPAPYFRLADNFAVLAEKALDASQRNRLVSVAGGPSREVSDAFAAKGYNGLGRAFAPKG
jgi:hypothetical protein